MDDTNDNSWQPRKIKKQSIWDLKIMLQKEYSFGSDDSFIEKMKTKADTYLYIFVVIILIGSVLTIL